MIGSWFGSVRNRRAANMTTTTININATRQWPELPSPSTPLPAILKLLISDSHPITIKPFPQWCARRPTPGTV